ncbi:MFS transporter [Streptomyces sp. SID3343]|uniref:MFS transporter n=1 Tax=Streptomyces sp. SID3343 TaxID=2690260 RepID=UPI00136CA341|nr:MFS transporter [Streptomyces sp. SID3343]MYV99716.1 DHA2 family efflux MFS transporter permease subunit [Streptomyces sp. SID3343]
MSDPTPGPPGSSESAGSSGSPESSGSPGSPEPPASSPPGEPQPDPHRWQALAVCLIAGFITLLDVSIVNVALPSIREGLGASESDIQWVLSGYALTFGLALVPAGRIGDARGRRMMFMLGLALFTAASALCGAAQNATWLVLARLLQGIAGGILTPQVSALIQQMFSGRERGRAFGMFGTVVGISTAVGPLLGGLIIKAFGEDEGWRWVFYVNLPIGIVALVLARRLLPAPDHASRACMRSLDPVGVLLLGSGVVLLLLPLVEERQWEGAGKWLLVPVALVLFAVFVRWEMRLGRRGEQPVVDLNLFKVRSYTLGLFVMLFYFAGFTSIFFVFTLYLQSGLGYSALLAGLTITPFAVGSALGAWIGGRLVNRFGRVLVTGGLAMVAIGLGGAILAVYEVPGEHVGWALVAPLAFAGLGSGFVIAPNQTLTLAEVPPAQGGSAGGVLQTAQRIGSAMGIAAVGSLFFSRLAADQGKDWAGPLRHGLVASVGFVVVAFVVAFLDLRQDRGAPESSRS